MAATDHIRASSCKLGLSRDAIFRLFKAAIKDDDELVDDLIHIVYDQMISFDQPRSDQVISLIIRRQRQARGAFKDLLKDVREDSLTLQVA